MKIQVNVTTNKLHCFMSSTINILFILHCQFR